VNIKSFNEMIYTDLSIHELESRLELTTKGGLLEACAVLGQQCPYDCTGNCTQN
jgi:hypothetical protein